MGSVLPLRTTCPSTFFLLSSTGWTSNQRRGGQTGLQCPESDGEPPQQLPFSSNWSSFTHPPSVSSWQWLQATPQLVHTVSKRQQKWHACPINSGLYYNMFTLCKSINSFKYLSCLLYLLSLCICSEHLIWLTAWKQSAAAGLKNIYNRLAVSRKDRRLCEAVGYGSTLLAN